MSFDPEIVRSLLDSEPEYTEDLRERYSAAQVFELARERQRELSESRVAKEHISAEWNASQKLLKELDTKAGEDGVLRQPVHLRGENLGVPKFSTSHLQDAALMSLEEPRKFTAENLEAYHALRDVNGIFAGFTVRFIENEDGTCTPSLAYQIAIGVHETAHSFTNVYATGAVGEAELAFVADEKMERVDSLVEHLYELCGKRLGKLNRLHMTLASAERYDAATTRSVAFDAAKVLEAGNRHTSQHIEDRLIDLVSQYIEPGSDLAIKASSVFMETYNNGEGSSYFEASNEDEAAELRGRCTGFIFLNKPITQNNSVKGYQKHKTLHAVLETPTQYAYVPLTHVQEFESL